MNKTLSRLIVVFTIAFALVFAWYVYKLVAVGLDLTSAIKKVWQRIIDFLSDMLLILTHPSTWWPFLKNLGQYLADIISGTPISDAYANFQASNRTSIAAAYGLNPSSLSNDAGGYFSQQQQ